MKGATVGRFKAAADKTLRKTQGKIILSVGFVAAVALASRHLGWLDSTQEFPNLTVPGIAREAPGLSAMMDPNRTGHLLPSQTWASAVEATASPFVRALAGSLDSIQTEPDESLQQEKLESVAKGIARDDVPEALTFLQNNSDSEWSRSLHLLLVRGWAEGSPRAAADWVLQSPPGPLRTEAIKGVAILWANQNLNDATEWVRQLPEGSERHGGIISVGYEAARTKPMEAITLAIELPEDMERDALIKHSATQWASADPKAAAEWALQIEEGGLRTQVLSSIATELGATDPHEAAGLAVRSLPAGKSQDNAIVGIAQRWVQYQPQNAAAWVTQFPTGTLRDAALENLVTLWADQDSPGVANWLIGARLGESQDAAIGAFVSKVAPAFPGEAARWAETIADDGIRAREIERVWEAWKLRDVKAARVWIAAGTLPQATKRRLLDLGTQ